MMGKPLTGVLTLAALTLLIAGHASAAGDAAAGPLAALSQQLGLQVSRS